MERVPIITVIISSLHATRLTLPVSYQDVEHINKIQFKRPGPAGS